MTEEEKRYLSLIKNWLDSLGVPIEKREETYWYIEDIIQSGAGISLSELPFFKESTSWGVRSGDADALHLSESVKYADKIAKQKQTQIERDIEDYNEQRRILNIATEMGDYAKRQAPEVQKRLDEMWGTTGTSMTREPFAFEQQALSAQRQAAASARGEEFAPPPFEQMPEEMQKRLGRMPGAGESYYPFLESLPEHLQTHYQGRMGELFGKFEQKAGLGAREDWFGNWQKSMGRWWEQKQTPQQMGGQGLVESVSGTGAPISWYNYAQADPLREPTLGQDPFQTFLKDYPFLEEFAAKPARERGFYKPRYAPPTRWI